MSTSIRQKITLFTLVPAVVFYSLVTVVYLYYTFHGASAEISRRHLHQSLQYASVVDGNLKEVLIAGRALQLHLQQDQRADKELLDYLNELFRGSRLVTGVGIIDRSSRDQQYWPRVDHYFLSEASKPISQIPASDLDQVSAAREYWYVDPSREDTSVFRTSLLLPLGLDRIVRVDIDGVKLIQPLEWLGVRTRIIILNHEGIVVYANGISMPRLRNLEQFITAGPCLGYSKINVTSEEEDPLTQFIVNPVRPFQGNEPCGIFREALRRVTEDGQSINFRISIRNDRKWLTATPVPTTKWYLSVSILEEDILAPLIRHVLLSISLIALTMVLTLACLWAVSGRITRPLNRLKKEMNAYAGSDNESQPDSCDEAVSLNRCFLQLKQRLSDRDQALQQARANNMGHMVQQLRGRYFYFNLSRQGDIVFVSPSVCSVLGYELWEFTGKIQSFLSDSPLNNSFGNILESLSAGLWQEPFEVEMLYRDGSVRRIEMFCTAHASSQLQDGDNSGSAIEGMGNDITHRIKDTEKFRSLIAGAPDATVITNRDGIIGLVNTRLLKLFAFRENDLINMPLSLLVDQTCRDSLPLLDSFDDGQPEQFCLEGFLSQGVSKQGRHFPMEISSNVLDTSDGILVSIVFRDISERVRIQGELVDAKEQAEKASQAKSMFLSNISHELRTPLNGVLGYAQLLLADKDIPPRYLTNLKLLEECGLHLLTLINDILDLTKIESSGIELDPQPYDLRATLNTVLANVRETAASKKLVLNLQVDDAVAIEVIGDNVKIRQVLINLLGNAVKFTDYGSITLKVYRQDSRLCFEVRDTGIGIAGHDLVSLFKPFSQLQAGRRQGGTGLGLAISYRLVKAMGGELQISSRLHEGSTFYFTTPYHALSADLPRISAATEKQLPVHISSKKQQGLVLVVDDNFNNRNMLVNALQGRCYQVETAEDGHEAIDMCRKTRYDIVLMDLCMPGIDGIAATRTIHQLPQCQSLNIMAISASVSEETRQKISKEDFCDFIAKPVHLDSLFERIDRYKSAGTNDDFTSINQEDREMIIAALHSSLEIGDVEFLLEQAREWQAKPSLSGACIDDIIRLCKSLDLQSLESMLRDIEQS